MARNQGIKSRNVTHPSVRTGSGSHSTCPAGTNMFGAMQGDHTTNKGRGTGYTGERLHNPEHNFQPVPFGNSVALNVGKGGPGTGRDTMRSGSQGTHGPVAGKPAPQGRDILSSFGPESSRDRR